MYSIDLIKKIDFIVNHPNIRYVIYPGGAGGERFLSSLINNIPSYAGALEYYNKIEYHEDLNRFATNSSVFNSYYHDKSPGTFNNLGSYTVENKQVDVELNNCEHIFQYICSSATPEDQVEEKIDKIVTVLNNGSMFPIRVHPHAYYTDVARCNIPKNSYFLGTLNDIDDSYAFINCVFKQGLSKLSYYYYVKATGIQNTIIESLYNRYPKIDKGLLGCIANGKINSIDDAVLLAAQPPLDRIKFYQENYYMKSRYEKIRKRYQHNPTYTSLSKILKNNQCGPLESEVGKEYAQLVVNDMKNWHQLNIKTMKTLGLDTHVFETYFGSVENKTA